MLPEQTTPDFWKQMEVIFDKKFEEYDNHKAKVRHEKVLNTILTQNIEIDAVKKQFSDLSEKISVLEQIDSFKDAQISAVTLKAIKDSIAVLERKFETQATLDNNFKRYQMFQNSCREQRSRSWSIRISNFQSPHCREKITMFKIYNTLILPTLKAAHRNGLLDFVPQYWGDVIEYAHHLPYNPKRKEIPQAIFRFHSRVYMTAFMISKRPILEDYAAKLNQYKSASQSVSPAPFYPGRMLKVQYDATRMNKNIQTFLHSTKLVARTKISGETIAFQIINGSKWQKVLNPYSDTLIGMTKPIPGTEMLFSTSLIEPPLARFNKTPYTDRGKLFPNSDFCNPLITEDDFEDLEPPPDASDKDEFPPLDSTAPAPPPDAAAAAAVVPEGVEVSGNEDDQSGASEEPQQSPAAASSPTLAAPPAMTAPTTAAPATRPASRAELQQQQKFLPARTAKKVNDSKINNR